MIEPTESESKAELDRFCDAMIAIREEIAEIERGQDAARGQPAEERAAHGGRGAGRPSGRTPTRASGPRSPRRGRARRKFWPPVGRIDNVLGDRNLVCTCPDISEYA